MSYQPQQPMGAPAPAPGQYPPAPQAQFPGQYPPQYVPAPVPTPPRSGKRGVLLLGVALLVLGIGGGAALFLLSGSTREQTIEKFARAPVGCTTTLEFDKAGTFTLYIELTGQVTAAGGDCDQSGQSYDWTGTTLPSFGLSMVDGNGQPVGLSDSTAYAYDTGAWRGQAVSQVQITATGSYRLTVDSPDSGFAVAIGGDPEADASTMQMAGIATAVAGLVLGLLLIVLGRRKGGSKVPPAVPQYAPVAPPGQYPPAQYPPAQYPPSSYPPAQPQAPAPPPLADRPRLPTQPQPAAPPPPPEWGATRQ